MDDGVALSLKSNATRIRSPATVLLVNETDNEVPVPEAAFAVACTNEAAVAAVTVSNVEPTTDPDVALMVLVPAASAEAKPPAAIAAVAVVPEAHVTEAVRFCVVVSL